MLPSGTTPAIIDAAASKVGVSLIIAENIANATYLPVATMENGLDTNLALKKRLAVCFETYTGADLTLQENDRVLQACVKIFIGNFRALSLDDIRLAFELCAAGTIDLKEKPVSYSGKISAVTMSSILRGYMGYRAKILQAIQREREEKRQEEINAERNKQKADDEQAFIDAFKMKSLEWKSWADVPKYAYDILANEMPQDGPLWVECKKQVFDEFIRLVSSGQVTLDPLVGDRFACACLVKQMRQDPDTFPAELMPRATIRYKKIRTYNYYISQ